MSDVMMGARVPRNLRAAANATAELNGQTLAEWIAALVADNLHPAARPLFLTADALPNEQIQSTQQTPAA